FGLWQIVPRQGGPAAAVVERGADGLRGSDCGGNRGPPPEQFAETLSGFGRRPAAQRNADSPSPWAGPPRGQERADRPRPVRAVVAREEGRSEHRAGASPAAV